MTTKKTSRRILGLVVLALLFAAAAVAVRMYMANQQELERAAAARKSQVKPPAGIASLGRIEPKDGVLRVAARSLSGQPSIVSELRVREGDTVRPGQLIALLDSRRQFEAIVRDLDARVAVAQGRLAVASTGAKAGDVDALQAEIARLEVAARHARTQRDRFQALFDKGAATVLERDRWQLELDSTLQAINQTRSRLASIQEVRAVDVQLARSEVDAARASVEHARVDVTASEVRAAVAGQVLRIWAHPGEEVGPQGILEIGRTGEMYAIAEVYESDVRRVQIGQKATVTGEALTEPLTGTVESIGQMIARNNILKTDPTSLTDARVVEVKVRLDQSERAAKLIHAKVTVVIGN